MRGTLFGSFVYQYHHTQDIGFTPTCDPALKWCIKSKGKCIDDLASTEMISARLDAIKNALAQERNEAAAAAHAASEAGEPGGAGADENDDPIVKADPSRYAEHGPQYWRALAAQTVKTYIKLIVEPGSESSLAAALADAEACKTKGVEQKNCVLLLLDVDLLAEAATRPTARRPVLPDGLIQRLLRGSMQGRGSPRNSCDECTVPAAGDVYFITDGGRDHLQKDILNSFVSGAKKTLPDAHVKNVWMVLSEQSIRSRKMIVRGEGINQKMQAYVITKNPISDMVPEKEFKGYSCTNRGNVIGTINLSPLDTAWSTTFETKKKLHGERLIGSADSCDKDARNERRDDSVEPAFYNFLPQSFYSSCMQAMAAATVIDLASGPGEAAKAAMTLRLPYLGLCLSEKHVLELHKHLTSWTLDCMAREGHQLYNPKYAQLRETEAEKNNTNASKPKDGSADAANAAKKTDPKKKRGMSDDSDDDIKRCRTDAKDSKGKRKASKSRSRSRKKSKKKANKKKLVISSSGSDSASSDSARK